VVARDFLQGITRVTWKELRFNHENLKGPGGARVNDPSTNDSFPIHPTGPDGLLFEGPTYRYTFVSPLLDSPDPMAIAQRTP